MVKLEDVCTFMTGGTPTSTSNAFYEDGEIPWLVSGDIHKREIFDCAGRITIAGMENSNAKFLPKDSVLIALNGQGKTRGRVALLRMAKATCNQSIVSINPISREQLHPDFLFYQLDAMYARIRRLTGDNERSGLSISIIKRIELIVPPLPEQERLVLEVAGYRKIIEGANQIITNYKPTVKIDPSWPLVRLSNLSKQIQYGLSSALNTQGQGYKTFRMNEIVNGRLIDNGNMKCADIRSDEFLKYRLKKGDLLFNRTNSFEHVGKTGILLLDGEYVFASYLIRLTIDDQIAEPLFVNFVMNGSEFQQGIKTFASRAIGQANINASNLAAYKIPLPPLEVQRAIVAELEAEAALVEPSRRLKEMFEQKMQAKVSEIWDEEGK